MEQRSLIDSIFSDGLPEDQMVKRVILTPHSDISHHKPTNFAAGYAEEPDNPDGTSNYSQEFQHTLTPF